MSTVLATAATLSRKARSYDAALIAIAAVLALLAVLSLGQAGKSLIFTAKSLLGIAPFLIASVAVAAYTKASGADNLIVRAFAGRMVPMIIAAAAMGAVSPFCSCGVIPLIAALLAMGVPLAPVMAFWLASPVMDPSMFVLTAGALGFEFAVAKTVASLGVGLIGGFGTQALQRFGRLETPLREGIGGNCAASRAENPGAVEWRFWREHERRVAFLSNARDNAVFLGKWLVLAFLLESLMLAYVPADLVARFAGGNGVLPVLTATLVGVPAYLNGYAALPLIQGLIEQGMAPGAGMAFLVAGGMTSIPAAIAVYALVRPRVFALYLSYAFVGAIVAGLAFGAVA